MGRYILQVVILISCTLGFTVSKSLHRRSIPDSVYINLVSALCIEDDGSVRDACLQNLSSSLIDAIYSNVNEDKFGKISDSGNSELRSFLLKQTQLPVKRGRGDKASGFYSNW
ncbi:uncharacterized protein LOC134719825 [Mytilus trossulus]|uniref:uncharacterized protein LOC134719825 n=1 Tax=Mytilus trossulus TaxID=6551 RepID=UPI003007D58A